MRRGHVPIRQCVGCREKRPKGELIRFIVVEETFKYESRKGIYPGRGCYTCFSLKCVELALKKGSFSRALRCDKAVIPPKEALLNGLKTEGIIDDDDYR